MVEVLAFRHGETDWNRALRFQGHTDIPLNALGKEQAASLVPHLEKHRPEVILSSDLVRAQETARIANTRLGAPIVIAPELRECHLGDAEGLHHNEIIAKFGHHGYERWGSITEEDLEFGFPGGETKRKVLERVRAYVNRFCVERPEVRKLALSTHGGCLKRLVHGSEGAPKEAVPLPNCAMYRLFLEGGIWRFGGSLN